MYCQCKQLSNSGTALFYESMIIANEPSNNWSTFTMTPVNLYTLTASMHCFASTSALVGHLLPLYAHLWA